MWRLKYPQLQQGLVGAWCPSRDRFRGSSQLTDQSTAKNHGTLTNMDAATDWVISPGAGGGYALDFDGLNDYVSFGVSKVTQFTNAFTIALWISPNLLVQTARYLMSKLNVAQSDNDWSILWEYANNQIEFYAGGYTGTNPRTGSGITVDTSNQWAHIAYSYNGSTWAGYKNGQQVFASSVSFTLASAGVALFFATFNGAGYHPDVKLDDIRLYDKGLPATLINVLAKRRGIAYEMEYVPIVKAGSAPPAASPWLYLNRSAQIIGSGVY